RDSDTFLVINSDSISDCDLTTLLKKHRESGALATMVLIPPRQGADYGVVEMGEHDRVQKISGRPDRPSDPAAGRYHFAGIHAIEPAIFEAIPPAGKSEINSEIYPRLITDGKVIRGVVHSGFWRELGTPRLYLEGSLVYLKEDRDPSLRATRHADGIYLDRASLPRDASVEPPVLIGRGAAIGAGCSFHDGVILGKQVRVGKGCSLRATVVWDGARIGDGARLSECIVTSGVYVPPDVSLSQKIFLRADSAAGRKERLERLGSCLMVSL
ncbi:MAG: sugar phosphate nucleotidyltransferase, partial [Candidatus Polarisedimenticolia bacterium]